MRQALDHGVHTVMLHVGRIVQDVSGDKRRGMKMEDLLHMFQGIFFLEYPRSCPILIPQDFFEKRG